MDENDDLGVEKDVANGKRTLDLCNNGREADKPGAETAAAG
jgi:hypothetical protein